ncbi:MAG: dTMP kinase [Ktedonobacterales bacterium]
MFITLEGGEGAGKSTQAVRLVDRLKAAGYRARFTREPGGTPIAAEIRALLLHPDESLLALTRAGLIEPDQLTQLGSSSAETDAQTERAAGQLAALDLGEALTEPMLPITELLLLSAARAQHVARIREWIAAGEIVVSDRYVDATRAYQGAGRGLDAEVIRDIEQIATGGLVSDLTLLFDLPVDVGQRRKRRHLRQSFLQLSLFESPAWNRIDNESLEFHTRVRSAYLRVAAAEPERFVVLDATPSADALFERVWQEVEPRLPPRTP